MHLVDENKRLFGKGRGPEGRSKGQRKVSEGKYEQRTVINVYKGT